MTCCCRNSRGRVSWLALGVLLGLAACTVTPSTKAATVSAGEASPTIAYGTIRAIRLVAAPSGSPRTDILGAIGTALLSGVDPGAGQRTEYIVATDDGRTVSVVQARRSALAVGQRVELLPGDTLRPAPGGS
jgi:outer membrane lipoprotein SlyB